MSPQVSSLCQVCFFHFLVFIPDPSKKEEWRFEKKNLGKNQSRQINCNPHPHPIIPKELHREGTLNVPIFISLRHHHRHPHIDPHPDRHPHFKASSSTSQPERLWEQSFHTRIAEFEITQIYPTSLPIGRDPCTWEPEIKTLTNLISYVES